MGNRLWVPGWPLTHNFEGVLVEALGMVHKGVFGWGGTGAPLQAGCVRPLEETGAAVSWGLWATAPERQCWAITDPDASQSPSPFSQGPPP